jgi:hypothetical protein
MAGDVSHRQRTTRATPSGPGTAGRSAEAVGTARRKSGAEEAICHTAGMTRVFVRGAGSMPRITDAYGAPPEAVVPLMQEHEQEDY